jgi:hypothetical protein
MLTWSFECHCTIPTFASACSMLCAIAWDHPVMKMSSSVVTQSHSTSVENLWSFNPFEYVQAFLVKCVHVGPFGSTCLSAKFNKCQKTKSLFKIIQVSSLPSPVSPLHLASFGILPISASTADLQNLQVLACQTTARVGSGLHHDHLTQPST